eukprot:5801930-Amphidinium_carterae.1
MASLRAAKGKPSFSADASKRCPFGHPGALHHFCGGVDVRNALLKQGGRLDVPLRGLNLDELHQVHEGRLQERHRNLLRCREYIFRQPGQVHMRSG